MIDMQEIMNSIAKRQEALAEAWKLNREAFFAALAGTTITRITVTFDGEGDSGQIEAIAAFNGDDPVPLPAQTIGIRTVSWGDNALEMLQQPLSSAIETLCYDVLEEQHGGWENNDGAFGEFTFDVAQRSVELQFHGRYMEIDTTTHTF